MWDENVNSRRRQTAIITRVSHRMSYWTLRHFSTGAFARLRKGNNTFAVAAKYRDLAAILKEMDSQAKRCMEEKS